MPWYENMFTAVKANTPIIISRNHIIPIPPILIDSLFYNRRGMDQIISPIKDRVSVNNVLLKYQVGMFLIAAFPKTTAKVNIGHAKK